MECEILNCKCVCHIYNPQQPNIKELLIKELEKEMNSSGDSINGITNNSTDSQQTASNAYFSDQDDLWERRRRLHSGEELPLAHEQFRTQLPSAQDIKRIYGIDISNQKETLQQKSSVHVAELVKSASPSKLNSESVKSSSALEHASSMPVPNASIPTPTPLNPLHKYKVKERDQIIRTLYQKAVNETKYKYKNLDANSKEFHEYVNKEADRQLDIWMQSNK